MVEYHKSVSRSPSHSQPLGYFEDFNANSVAAYRICCVRKLNTPQHTLGGGGKYANSGLRRPYSGDRFVVLHHEGARIRPSQATVRQQPI